ncbi:MAG: hypothetical protein AAGN82_18745 [Myxococcota bacterium]
MLRRADVAQLPTAAQDALAAVDAHPRGPHQDFTFFPARTEAPVLARLLWQAVLRWMLALLVGLTGIGIAVASTGAVGALVGLAVSLAYAVAASVWAFSPVVRVARFHPRQTETKAYGVFLLDSGVLVREPEGLHFVAKQALQEVLAMRHAEQASRGEPMSYRPERTDVTLTYTDERGRRGGIPLFSRAWLGHDPPVLHALQRWLHGTNDVEAFGEAPVSQLTRTDWADQWRRFWRLRGVALFLTSATAIVALLWPLLGTVVIPIALVGCALATAVARLRYGAFRCPRCGLSPRIPVHGAQPRYCLTCGLPIFTAPRALPSPGPDDAAHDPSRSRGSPDSGTSAA